MRLGRTKFAVCLLCFSLACPVPQVGWEKRKAATRPSIHSNSNSNDNSNDQRRALHALNRLTFGPRPGDLQQVDGDRGGSMD